MMLRVEQGEALAKVSMMALIAASLLSVHWSGVSFLVVE